MRCTAVTSVDIDEGLSCKDLTNSEVILEDETYVSTYM